MLMQWHITDRCNLRCKHCYHDAYAGQEAGFETLLNIVDQFEELVLERGAFNSQIECASSLPHKGMRHQITVTGGEPFSHPEILRLLEYLDNKKQFHVALLTNGTLLDHEVANFLRNHKPLFVQVSIEGTRATHDSIRGQGSYDKAVEGLKKLVRHGITTMISFTAHRGNYREFPEVVRMARDIHASYVWSDRLIPFGAGKEMQEQCLSPHEVMEYLHIMHESKKRARRSFGWRKGPVVLMNRALQFLVAGNGPYSCAAGRSLITVMPNGDVLPCRRMPIRVGNCFETSLLDLYNTSPTFQELRNDQRLSEGCAGCAYKSQCKGGLKCLAYAVTGDPFSGDPGCPYKEA